MSNNKELLNNFLLGKTISFDIEVSALCNAHCIMCPHDKVKRNKYIMDKKEMIILADRLLEFFKDYKIIQKRILFAGMGECTLNENLFEMIKYLNSKNNLKLILVTNGANLNKQKIQAAKESGVSAIAVSFQGIKKDEYKYIMSLDYDLVLQNIEECIKQVTSNPLNISHCFML